MKLMSLFDGSGGFPLAASLCGIEPVYAAEVEPYPIAVTKNRFPKMKHLGDVSKVKGGEIEPVDIITFGSPCQDMSIAGKRAGLKHADMGDDETTRSGLFLEAIRIIKEMREATNGVYPRYAIWENVPGAFSSNRGEDFRTVLEEFIRVKEKDVVMPSVPAAGWPYADCYSGNGWSLAYRVFDAQYWGVPQRRRRIYLVADFRGERAKEILFERKGLRGDIEESRTHGQETARCAKNSVGTAIGGVDRYNQSFLPGIAQTLRASGGGDYCIPTVLAPVAVYCHQGNGIGASVKIAKTLDTSTQDPSKNQGGIALIEKYVYDTRGNGDGETVPTITGDHNNRVTNYTCLAITRCYDIGEARLRTPSEYIEKSPTITARCGTGSNNVPGVVYCLQGNGIDRADTAGCNGKGWKEDTSYTLNTIDKPAVVCAQKSYTEFKDESTLLSTLKTTGGSYGGGSENIVVKNYIVRRLTPTECARLQGFPDLWGYLDKKESFTDEEYKFWLEVRNTYTRINNKAVKDYTKAQMLSWYNKLHSDSAEYKMWGNGIALPNALYVMQGIAEVVGVHHSK
jgi:DNA (cytosine-5)-methyltransferase 1